MNRDTPEFTAFLANPLAADQRARLEVILYYHFGLEHRADIAALLDLILNRDVLAIAKLSPAARGSVYLPALLGLVRAAPLSDGFATLQEKSRIHTVDESLDAIAAQRDDRIWDVVRCLNFFYRSKIRPARRVAIVASIRNEGVNLLEWIAHHRVMGVEDFFLYVNDNDDGSTDLLNLLARHGVIQVAWNRTGLLQAGSADMFPIQAKCFLHVAHILPESRDYEWLLFLDPDEFLITRPVMETPEMPCPLDDLFGQLAAMPVAPAAVAFNWKFCTAPLTFRRQPGLNFERFTQQGPDEHVKTLARGSHCVSFHTAHIPRLLPGDVVLDGSLNPVASPYFRMPAAQFYGQVNHYYNKSFEEFVGKHLRIWGELGLDKFFSIAGNRETRPREMVPDAWRARVRAEMARLQSLDGVAAEVAGIEARFADLIKAYDAQHGLRGVFDRMAAGR